MSMLMRLFNPVEFYNTPNFPSDVLYLYAAASVQIKMFYCFKLYENVVHKIIKTFLLQNKSLAHGEKTTWLTHKVSAHAFMLEFSSTLFNLNVTEMKYIVCTYIASKISLRIILFVPKGYNVKHMKMKATLPARRKL